MYSTAAGSSSEKISVLNVTYPLTLWPCRYSMTSGSSSTRKFVGAVAGVEVVEAEVDGVRAVGDGGAHRVPVAGGGEQLGIRLATAALYGGAWSAV